MPPTYILRDCELIPSASVYMQNTGYLATSELTKAFLKFLACSQLLRGTLLAESLVHLLGRAFRLDYPSELY